MSEPNRVAVSNEPKIRSWGNRILVASLSGILFLTLYPFEFSLHSSLPAGRSAFLLGTANKGGGALDVVLNILLFLPFGFGLAAKLRKEGRSWLFVFFTAWLAGAVFSYCIEFAQAFIPARDSGWEDVFSNSTGSVVGWFVFELVGAVVLQLLTAAGRLIGGWMIPRRAVFIAAVYFLGWALYSPQLGKQTHFGTWTQDCFFVFGNDATGRRPWKGKLLRVEIWDQALSSQLALRVTRESDLPSGAQLPLASFDFSVYPPLQRNAKILVPLNPAKTQESEQGQELVVGSSSIASSLPVSNLITDLQGKNQFSIRVVFVPDDVRNPSGRIVSISPPSGIPDLFVGQNAGDLYFWFRNRLSVLRPALAWDISKLLVPGQARNMLFSYDGSVLRLFVDGRKVQERYWGPGTALASLIRRVKQGELNGYRDIFYAVVFLPIGCFLGVSARNVNLSRAASVTLFAFVLVLGPLCLEWEFALIDGRGFSIVNFGLGILMSLLGLCWINADRPSFQQQAAI